MAEEKPRFIETKEITTYPNLSKDIMDISTEMIDQLHLAMNQKKMDYRYAISVINNIYVNFLSSLIKIEYRHTVPDFLDEAYLILRREIEQVRSQINND